MLVEAAQKVDSLIGLTGHFLILTCDAGKRIARLNPRRFIVGKKLYVGNLGYGVTSSDLEGLLSAFGSVRSAEVIMDRDTGRSKGFGFAEMSNDQEAQTAITGLNGKEQDGRALTVNEARPREERSGSGGGGRSGGGRRY
jgi:cold-inducible RNA-binding protein